MSQGNSKADQITKQAAEQGMALVIDLLELPSLPQYSHRNKNMLRNWAMGREAQCGIKRRIRF